MQLRKSPPFVGPNVIANGPADELLFISLTNTEVPKSKRQT